MSSAGVFTLFTLFTQFFNSAKTRIDCKNYLVVKVQRFRTGLALNNSTFVLLLKASQQFSQTNAPISSRYNYPCWLNRLNDSKRENGDDKKWQTRKNSIYMS
jgi:hypothetical protein